MPTNKKTEKVFLSMEEFDKAFFGDVADLSVTTEEANPYELGELLAEQSFRRTDAVPRVRRGRSAPTKTERA